MYNKKYLAFVIAGGKGERLLPLTKDRTKASVPFGGKYRIVDFVISNFINSSLYSIYIIVQYKSQSLIEHIRTGRRRTGLSRDHFITVVPAQMRTEGASWYKGTADSIFQNVNLILDAKPDLVLVFAADHIYRMDVRQMIEFHIQKNAEATIATLPVSVNDAHKFGIIHADKNGHIVDFIEKPKNARQLFSNEATVSTSMGNYIFNTDILLDTLLKDAKRLESEHDFGKSIIPNLIKTNNVYAYSFESNIVPGIKSYEEKAYWRDVGSLETYWQANMNLLGKKPVFDLNNNDWPIIAAGYDGPPARIISADIKDSIIGEGSYVNNAKIYNSIISGGTVIEDGAEIRDSIIMGFNRIGKDVKIKRAIIDRFNTIPDDASIGYNPADDKKNYFIDKDSGLVIVPRGGRNWPI